MGPNYPTRLHSRDSAYPNFDLTVLGEPDGNLMCGAMAPGPYPGEGANLTRTSTALSFRAPACCPFRGRFPASETSGCVEPEYHG